uniref:Mycothiol-dependent maleylpyruvate isomerase metal-binding domain-containing protein n=1 Tax=Solibacter usitatus (strain Ellin6076) TaxID=234267 RepID=Q01VV0_SOLUE
MEPILCAHLLRKVDEKLVELLESLRPGEWELPTVAPEWTVRDVAAHLLDTPLRKLSTVRDGCVVEPAVIRSPQDVAAMVNRLNREGVQVFRRLSPPVLISLMRAACRESADFHESLDPFAPAAFAVSWAGEEQSLNWFDTARELTERWHHQQQIRHATGRPGIITRELYHPVLDCFLRGLPHAYRDTAAARDTVVRVEVGGDCGGVWQISRVTAGWQMTPPDGRWDARIVVPQEIAWRVFTKGIARGEAERQMSIEGDGALAAQLLSLTAIVA